MQTRHSVTDVDRTAAMSAEQVCGAKALVDAEVHTQEDCLCGKHTFLGPCGLFTLQGLGATVARYLAAQGAKVIVSARSEDKLQVLPRAATPH